MYQFIYDRLHSVTEDEDDYSRNELVITGDSNWTKKKFSCDLMSNIIKVNYRCSKDFRMLKHLKGKFNKFYVEHLHKRDMKSKNTSGKQLTCFRF